ncbi:MAG: TIR domain-containing protein [Cyanothece sp. SIO1E1]|nr:TIR domain-containing protein [Cyanothece sp. SIO1E1]
MPTANSIFVSYRRSDSSDVTGRIYDCLADHFGHDVVFRDVNAIPLGVDFRAHLHETVGQCHVLIAVIGLTWLAALQERLEQPAVDWVRAEIETALGRGIPVIPLLVRGAGMPGESKLPESLRALAFRNAAQARSDLDFHTDMDRLIRRLQEIVGVPESVATDMIQHSRTLLKTLNRSQLSAVKKRVLEKRIGLLTTQYEALSDQYDNCLDAGQKVVLKNKLDKLEQELEVIELTINQIR